MLCFEFETKTNGVPKIEQYEYVCFFLIVLIFLTYFVWSFGFSDKY